ncbi:MAG: DUF3164 family protein [Alphaproteobacteria bacterium]
MEKEIDGKIYLEDGKGNLTPKSQVKPIDLLRDDVVSGLIEKAKETSARIKEFKKHAFEEISKFIEISAEQYQVKLGGKKGNVTLFSYDGRFKIERRCAEKINFGEQLHAAKALIDECLREWSAGANDKLITIVNQAFQVDEKGNISTAEILGLRKHNFTEPKWQEAMKAISDAITIVSSKDYVRLYERVGETDFYSPISLDVAADF